MQRKFVDWKKTKLFGCRWNWEKRKSCAASVCRFPSFLMISMETKSMGDNWFYEYSILKNKFLFFLFKNLLTLLFKWIVSRDSIFSIFIKFCEVISVCSYVRRCFALKGQCHKIFCLGGIPRKCSTLTQILREQKMPGPLLLLYFMV